MKILFKSKDGGPESNVTGYWLIESKEHFSLVLLRFAKGSRDSFHNHAFNAISWVISGALYEECQNSSFNEDNYILPSILPIYTSRSRLHKVHGVASNTWVLSFRGPWAKTWKEYNPKTGYTTLTNGRKIVNENMYN